MDDESDVTELDCLFIVVEDDVLLKKECKKGMKLYPKFYLAQPYSINPNLITTKYEQTIILY